MSDKDILNHLKEIRNHALARYSNFPVGAIIVNEQDRIYTGHNIESSVYGLSLCAERVALFKALSEGEREFRKIYILANNNEFCPPCGSCRQVLMDYAPGIEVILMTDDGRKNVFPLKELLPVAFTRNRLEKTIKK